MAKFKLELDTRVPLADGKYNLSVRMCHKQDVMYLKIVQMTPDQFEKVFTKTAMDKKSIEFRQDSYDFKSRCESIFIDMNPFDKKKFRELVYKKKEISLSVDSFKITNLVDRYLQSNTLIKLHTRDQYRTAVNKFDHYNPGISILRITPKLLMEFEKKMLEDDISQFTISSYLRHLRSLINHFLYNDKILPPDFRYPFGKNGGYIIRKGRNQKFVMSNDEIKKVVEYRDFQTTDEEYARDTWVLSYWCNGLNYADLFRLRWTNIHDDLIMVTRMKTENTTRNNSRDIIIPILPKLKGLIEKLGVKESPYILGHLKKGYREENFRSQKDWQLQKIRVGLNSINERLNLSVPLKMKTARDCYSETLRRAGWDADIRDEMMGHSPVYKMAAHYQGVIDKDRLFEINSSLL